LAGTGESVRLLTPYDLYRINADLIRSYGGFLPTYPNLRPGQDLGYVIALIHGGVSFGGYELHPTLPAKAAALAWHIIKGHPFHDTNKRTAMEAMIELFELNDWKTEFEAESVVSAALAVEAGSMSQADLEVWMTTFTTPPVSGEPGF